MRKRIILSIFALVLGFTAASAQNVSDLRLSEIVVENSCGVTDEYGSLSPWIEIHNSSFGTVNYAGCFLSVDPSLKEKYLIPKGDASTSLKPKQCAVFFADGESWRGTYHSSFTIERGCTVYLISNDGRTVIDSLTIPEDLEADMSIQRHTIDGQGFTFVDRIGVPSPGVQNDLGGASSKSQIMEQRDPTGLIMTFTSIFVVFTALFILYLAYNFIGKLNTGAYSRKKKAPAKASDIDSEVAAAISLALQAELSSPDNEIAAAIALALKAEEEGSTHDYESYIITIK